MLRQQVGRVRERVSSRLESAFVEEHSPRQVAASFGIGMFVTALPTLGVGVLVFVVLAYLFEQLSKIALFASVLVLSPPVKWGVYATSFWLGNTLLGPLPRVGFDGEIAGAGVDVLARLWLGNFLLAVVFGAAGYVVALRLVAGFRRRVEPT